MDAEGREGPRGPEESRVLWVSDGWRKDVVRGGCRGSSLRWSCGCRKQLGPGCVLVWSAQECAEFKVEREWAGFWYNIEMELGPACLRTSDISLPCFSVGFLCRSMWD